MKLTSFYQKSTKYRAVLSFWNFFQKYRSTTGGTFGFQVPSTGTDGTFNKVPSTGTAGTSIKYRAHLCKPSLLDLVLNPSQILHALYQKVAKHLLKVVYTHNKHVQWQSPACLAVA